MVLSGVLDIDRLADQVVRAPIYLRAEDKEFDKASVFTISQNFGEIVVWGLYFSRATNLQFTSAAHIPTNVRYLTTEYGKEKGSTREYLGSSTGEKAQGKAGI
jgi:hypothetical protein